MNPPVLSGVFAYKGFDGLGVLFGDPAYGVFLVCPFFREDDAFNADFEFVLVADASAVAYGYGDVVDCCHDRNAFEGAGRFAEEVDEQAFFACVLVCNEAEACALFADFGHEVGCALFVYDFLTVTFADASDVLVQVGVVQGAGHAVEVEPEQAQDVAEDFEVAVMACDQDKAFAFLHEPFGGFDMDILAVCLPIVFSGQVGCEQHIHTEHGNVFETASGCFDVPGVIFVRVGDSEIFECTFPSSCITEPEQFAAHARGGECQPCGAHSEQDCECTHQCIHTPVQSGMRFFMSSAFSGFFHWSDCRHQGPSVKPNDSNQPLC